MKINMWNQTTKDQIILDGGSVQNLNIPTEIKDLYKTVWEIKQKILLIWQQIEEHLLINHKV